MQQPNNLLKNLLMMRKIIKKGALIGPLILLMGCEIAFQPNCKTNCHTGGFGAIDTNVK